MQRAGRPAQFGPLALSIEGSVISVQHYDAASQPNSRVDTLVVELGNGSASVIQDQQPLGCRADTKAVLIGALIGMMRLREGGAVLAVASDLRQVRACQSETLYEALAKLTAAVGAALRRRLSTTSRTRQGSALLTFL